MAHELRENDYMVSTRNEVPWHKIGTVVPDDVITAEKAMELAKLDWRVYQSPLFAHPTTGYILENEEAVEASGLSKGEIKSMTAEELIERGLAVWEFDETERIDSNNFAMIREDTKDILGVVGARYRPVQNGEAFGFMDEILMSSGAHYETAGSLFNGRKVWMLAKLPNTFDVVDNDRHETYLLLSNSHDSSQSLLITLTAVRVVCNNTLTWALNSRNVKHTFSIRHTDSLPNRVDEARHILGLAPKYFKELETFLKALKDVPFDGDQMTGFTLELFGHKDKLEEENGLEKIPTRTFNQVKRVKELFTEAAGNDRPGIRDTAYAAFNAVTEFETWEKNTHGTEEIEKIERRMNNVWHGDGQTLTAQASRLLAKVIA